MARYAGDPKLAKETIDIEASGATVAVKLFGADLLSLSVRGDGTAEYVLDARLGGSDTWTEDVDQTYSGAADYDDVVRTGMPEVRVRCTSGTGTPDDSAEIKLAAGGG
jgi:hypothetical protein